MSIEEGEAKARELNVMFIETSAKAGFNIKVHLSLISYICQASKEICSSLFLYFLSWVRDSKLSITKKMISSNFLYVGRA